MAQIKNDDPDLAKLRCDINNILGSNTGRDFRKTEIGRALISPQTSSNWLNNGPPATACAGFALAKYAAERDFDNNPVRQSFLQDVRRTGLWAEKAWQIFFVSPQRDLKYIRFWDGVHVTRRTSFNCPTILRASTDVSENANVIAPQELNAHLEKINGYEQEKNTLLYQFHAALNPDTVTWFGYSLYFPGGLINNDKNQWLGGGTIIPSNTSMILVSVADIAREPSWISIARDLTFDAILKKIDTDEDFSSKLEDQSFLRELDPWLLTGKTRRQIGGDPTLPKPLEDYLSSEKGELLGLLRKGNVFFVSFPLINPLTYQIVILQFPGTR